VVVVVEVDRRVVETEVLEVVVVEITAPEALQVVQAILLLQALLKEIMVELAVRVLILLEPEVVVVVHQRLAGMERRVLTRVVETAVLEPHHQFLDRL
jgi:hypothetical protein